MKSKARSVKEYLDEVPTDRKVFFKKLRDIILENLSDVGRANKRNQRKCLYCWIMDMAD